MSRPARRLRIVSGKSQESQLSTLGGLFGQLVDRHIGLGSTEAEAIEKARQACGVKGGLPESSSLVKISEVNHTFRPRNGTMQATKAKSNGKHAKVPKRKLTRKPAAVGNEWHQRFSRGVRRWRESRDLTMPEAALKYGIHYQVWYKVEGGSNEQTTASHVTAFEEASGMKIEDFLKLGDEPR